MTVPSTTKFRKNLALTAISRSGDALAALNKREKIALNAIIQSVDNQYFLKYPELEEIGRQNIKLEDIQNRGSTIKIDEALMMSLFGYKGNRAHNKGQVMDILEGLSGAKLSVDGFGVARARVTKEDWDDGFSVLISSAIRKDGSFQIEIPSVVVYRIINPEVSIAGLEDWSSFSNKNTPDIVDTLQFYYENKETHSEWYELNTLKTILGIAQIIIGDNDMSDEEVKTAKTYEKFGEINKKILKVIRQDIEKRPDIPFTFKTETKTQKTGVGRPSVSHVRFEIIPKEKSDDDAHRVIHKLQYDAWKHSLQDLGVAKNQLDTVIDEVELEDDLKIEFMNWALAKAEHYRRIKELRDKDFNFGGLIRKTIFREKLEEWVKVHDLIKQVCIEQKEINTVSEKQIREVRKKIKVSITQRYLKMLSEMSFVSLKDGFIEWLENSYVEKQLSEREDYNISAMSPESTLFTYFMFYLEKEKGFYTYQHFADEIDIMFGNVPDVTGT
jgi:hypothetical protein